jgi:hypothetical protein
MANMAPEEALKNFQSTAQIWFDGLDTYDDEQFSRKPDEESWSIGQVYSHLLRSANHFQLGMIDQCVSGTAEQTEEGMNEPGQAVFEQGGFPNRPIKVPASPGYTPPQPESIDEVRAGLASLDIRMRQTMPLIAGANPALKSRHPFFGMMNAAQWYELVGMHFRHHLNQKARLDAWLGVGQAQEQAAR